MKVNDCFLQLDECCAQIEVYYQTEIEAPGYIYGTYTKMSESVNGRSHYQSDFGVGKLDIWWCVDYKVWMLGPTSVLGQCQGFAYTAEDVQCPQNVGWNWFYTDGQGWIEAGEDFGVKCTSRNEPSNIDSNIQSLI